MNSNQTQVGAQTPSNLYYWIAINGPSCARAGFPMRSPSTHPVAQQLLGFPSEQESREAQEICLSAPMKLVRAYLKSLAPDVASGRIKVIQPAHPEPPTRGQTVWTDIYGEEDQ
jgi:hypothetical protein